MHRQLVYPGAIPLETDLLYTTRFAYTAIAKLAGALFGTNTLINGGATLATSPASLSVQVTPCEIYSLQNLDNSAYSSLPIDTTHQIVKQGFNLDAVTLSCPAPGTAGYSVNYLIEYGFSETDAGSTVLPYYNATNPAQAYAGPNNSGSPNYTYRQNTVNIQVKAGIAATTGSQTTPSPDSGFVGGYVVTVAYGQTTITSGNIALYTGAPFLTETLLNKISQATGDARYAQIAQVQNGSLIYGVDTGTANAYAATISPALTSYSIGSIYNIKIANTNSGASTLNLNGLGTKNIKLSNGNNPNVGDLATGIMARLAYDGTNFQLQNPATAVLQSTLQMPTPIAAIDAGTANAYVLTVSPAITAYTFPLRLYMGVVNTNTGASTLNVNGVGAALILMPDGTALPAGALVANMVAELVYTYSNAFILLNPNNTLKRVVTQVFTASGTYTPSAGLLYAMIEVMGAGGAGGGTGSCTSSQLSVAGGGGGGGYAKSVVPAATIGASQTVTIGVGGVGVASTVGANGGTSSFGSLITATGGQGGAYIPPSTISTAAAGGSGGTASGATLINQSGQSGCTAIGIISSISVSGAGGGGLYGQGGGSSISASTGSATSAGIAGTLAGAGGSGANTYGVSLTKAGGNGAAGIVIVTEFCRS